MKKLVLSLFLGVSLTLATSAMSQDVKKPTFNLDQAYTQEQLAQMETQAKNYILSLVPLGSDVQTALTTLKEHVSKEVDYNHNNGITLPEKTAKARGISGQLGVQSIKVLVAKTEKPKVPAISYLYVFLGFDATGKLIAVEPITEIDAI